MLPTAIYETLRWDNSRCGWECPNADWMDLLNGPLNGGQIALGCGLGYLDFRHGDKDWREGRAALADWFDGFSLRPAMQETAPKD